MKKTLLMSLFLAGSTMAGTMSVKGISNIGQTPDYIELKISTLGKCFDSAKNSNLAAESAATKLRKVLVNHIDIEGGDQLVVTAGHSARQKETITSISPITNRRETSVVCEKGWRSSRDIIVKFANLHLFETLNPRLLDLVDHIELEQRINNEGIVSATIHAPIPRLTPETTAQMEDQALQESLVNASNKFQTVKRICNLVNVSIENISEASSVIRPYRDGTGAGNSDNSLNFALQYVHLAYNITFSFDNTSGSCVADGLL